jgi:hypothetical protein
MRFLMLACLLPAATAEFDKCARATAKWVGFDQGLGESRAQAVTHSGSHVYAGGHAKGDLSFGSKHADGRYHDHMGISQVHDTPSDVTIHHETGSYVGNGSSSSYNKKAVSSQLGQDAIIYKISDDGKPESVYGMDTVPADGAIDGKGINGKSGGWSYITGIDDFDLAGEADQIAAVGMIRGILKFPQGRRHPGGAHESQKRQLRPLGGQDRYGRRQRRLGHQGGHLTSDSG